MLGNILGAIAGPLVGGLLGGNKGGNSSSSAGGVDTDRIAREGQQSHDKTLELQRLMAKWQQELNLQQAFTNMLIAQTEVMKNMSREYRQSVA